MYRDNADSVGEIESACQGLSDAIQDMRDRIKALEAMAHSHEPQAKETTQ
jgi:hypothetical protein